MKLTPLFKMKTVVAQVMIIAMMITTSLPANTAGVPGTGTPTQPVQQATTAGYPPAENELQTLQKACAAGDQAACKAKDAYYNRYTDQSNSRQEDKCERAINDWKTDSGKLRSSCSSNYASCLKRASACLDGEVGKGGMEMAAGAFDPSGCSSRLTNSSCPELNAGTAKEYQDEKKDLESQKKDAKKDIEDLMKNANELTAKTENQTQELKDQIADNEKNLRDQERKMMETLEDTLANVDAEKQKALDQAQDIYNKMDEEYIKMRDAARRAASDIAAAKAKLQTTCRTYAMQQYKQAEAQLNQRMEEENKIIKNQGSLTAAAGYYKRKSKEAEKQKNMNYANYFKDCVGGVAPEGAAALEKIGEMERKKKDDDALLVDKAAAIENQRLQVLDKLKKLEESSKTQKNQAIERANKNLQTLRQDYMNTQQRNQEKFYNQQQQMLREQQLLDKQLQSANQDLQRVDSEITMNHSRLQCAKLSGGSMSESRGEQKIKSLGEAMEAIGGVEVACSAIRSSCSSIKSKQEMAKYESSCSKVSEAIEEHEDSSDSDKAVK